MRFNLLDKGGFLDLNYHVQVRAALYQVLPRQSPVKLLLALSQTET
jgi:hypothetical protein